jgi:hypothetical protein
MRATCPVDLILIPLPIIDKEQSGCADLVISASLQLEAGFFLASSSTVKMETALCFKTSGNFYQATRHHNPEGCSHRQKLKYNTMACSVLLATMIFETEEQRFSIETLEVAIPINTPCYMVPGFPHHYLLFLPALIR